MKRHHSQSGKAQKMLVVCDRVTCLISTPIFMDLFSCLKLKLSVMFSVEGIKYSSFESTTTFS